MLHDLIKAIAQPNIQAGFPVIMKIQYRKLDFR